MVNPQIQKLPRTWLPFITNVVLVIEIEKLGEKTGFFEKIAHPLAIMASIGSQDKTPMPKYKHPNKTCSPTQNPKQKGRWHSSNWRFVRGIQT